MATEKRCRRCGTDQLAEEFRPTPSNRDGLDSWCRTCRREYGRQWRKGHPAYFKTYYQANRPRYANASLWVKRHLAHKPCAAGDCDQPRHMSNAGYLYSRCRGHQQRSDHAKYRRSVAPHTPVDPWARFLKARGLTPEIHARILDAQGGGCAICGATTKLRIDHDHSCCSHRPTLATPWCGRCVRGLLCDRCNFGIGFLRDDADRARRAAEYLDTVVRNYSRKGTE